MSEFLGSRISLISKSNIRYVGTLHEINSEDSTVSLENVQSFGTEGREGSGPLVAPSDQVYDYIVFRGSDVKDLRIEQPAASQPQPPAVPNDPAILGARPRPDAQGPPSGPSNQRPPQPGAPGAPGYGYNNFYGAPGSWGRGGPMPGPGPGGYGGMPYHPNGWAPGGPGNFPPGPPGGPAPWGNYPYPPGMGPAPGGPGPMNGPPVAQPAKSQPAGPTEKKDQPPASGPQKPPVDADKAAAPKPEAEKSVPTGPRNGKAALPAAGPNQPPSTKFQPPVSASSTQAKPTAAPTDAAINDATEAAKAAVALAMAKLNAAPEAPANSVDNLSKRVNDMRINANTRGHQARGGRHHGGRPHHKVEVPSEDFDFDSANAKFNKDEIKSPEQQAAPELDVATPVEEAEPEAAPVYNKSKSFFDNISSEAKERAANGGQKAGGREWRGEEQRKNIETFGQGSVDGGYRNNYRGRGRGGFRGRGRGGQTRGGYQNRQPRPYVEN